MNAQKDTVVTNVWWTGLGIHPRRNGGAFEPLLAEFVDLAPPRATHSRRPTTLFAQHYDSASG